jgi:hypothetical protein
MARPPRSRSPSSEPPARIVREPDGVERRCQLGVGDGVVELGDDLHRAKPSTTPMPNGIRKETTTPSNRPRSAPAACWSWGHQTTGSTHPTMRWKGVEVPVRIADTTALPADELLAAVRTAWALGAELSAWLATHVGPTELSPEEVYGGGRR